VASFRYLEAVRKVIAHFEETQAPAIERAADMVIESITHGGTVYCADIGHSNQHDFLNRAGGLAAVQGFSFSFSLNDLVAECNADRPRPEPFERDLETIRFAVKASNLRAGDVMLLGSVSGKNRHPVELALACRAMGVKVIAFTAMEYTRQVESLHPSGKRLFEVADVAIDNGAPYGDAAVEIPGLEIKALPISGVAMTIAGWLLWERVIEKMAAAGDPPTVFMSVNREGGPEHYKQMREQFNRRGY
jgi:uncharacterized phosphosugar-binding protein